MRKRVRIFGPGGGFVFNPVHNIQQGTPPQNIIAAYDAAREAGVYPISARGPFRAAFGRARLQYPSFFSTSPIDSSMMSMHFSATSRSMTMGGLMRRMWPAGIHARPLRNAAW